LRGVGAEAKTASEVKFLHRPQQGEDPFAEQIVEGMIGIDEFLDDRKHQPRVRFDDPVAVPIGQCQQPMHPLDRLSRRTLGVEQLTFPQGLMPEKVHSAKEQYFLIRRQQLGLAQPPHLIRYVRARPLERRQAQAIARRSQLQRRGKDRRARTGLSELVMRDQADLGLQ